MIWLWTALAAPLPDGCALLPDTEDGRPWGSITYVADLGEDVAVVEAQLDGVYEVIASALEVEALETTLEVVLHPPGDVLGAPAPAVRLHPGVAVVVGDHEVASLHLVHPSCQRGKSGLGQPFDETWLRKTLVHEISALYLHKIASTSGWAFWEQPPWFVQGTEEYLALTLSTPDRWALVEKKARVGRVQATSSALLVDRPYLEGALIIRNLVGDDGPAGLRALLTHGGDDVYDSLSDQGHSPATLRELVRDRP